MVQKIYKGSDILIDLVLKDVNGTPFRISATNEFNIKFFTTNPEVYIKGSYVGDEYTGIITGKTVDYMALNAIDLEKLEDGVLNYIYTVRTVNTDFKDGFYDEIVKGQTNFYLKSKFYCNEI